MKEFLADDHHRIPLSELVMTQGNELAQKTIGPEFPSKCQRWAGPEAIKRRLRQYEDISQVALAIMVAGCYYGTKAHEKLWIDLLQRVANPGGGRSGTTVLLKMRRYPALLLSYGGGICRCSFPSINLLGW